jgi:two-component system cell cycle sensor histidine kinase/response regulator CckA
VRVDRGQLHQVITNLVVNARDAIPSTGTVSIGTRREQRSDGSEWVVLSVADDGLGMTPEVRARIFEPFFSTKGPARGTGLGLAMVYGIVTQSGGSIAVQSEPGKGSRFDIQLPRVEAGPRTPPRPRSGIPSAPHSPREVVLLVEDDAMLRKAALRTLEAAGYRTIEAQDPMDALHLAADPTCRIDLVLSDVIMPDMSGTELAHRLRLARPELPVLLVSGYAATEVQEADLAELWFLAKPFTPRQLLAKVREVLDAATTRAAPRSR